MRSSVSIAAAVSRHSARSWPAMRTWPEVAGLEILAADTRARYDHFFNTFLVLGADLPGQQGSAEQRKAGSGKYQGFDGGGFSAIAWSIPRALRNGFGEY